MMPLAADIAGAAQTVKIKQLSLLPADGGGDGARRAIGAAEQIRAATGVDLGELLRRLSGAGAAPPPLPAVEVTVQPDPPLPPAPRQRAK
jgi:flotillin